MHAHMQGAIVVSLKNAFREFRRDKAKKHNTSGCHRTEACTEKPELPGARGVVLLSAPTVPSGMYVLSCIKI